MGEDLRVPAVDIDFSTRNLPGPSIDRPNRHCAAVWVQAEEAHHIELICEAAQVGRREVNTRVEEYRTKSSRCKLRTNTRFSCRGGLG